ncbi:putative membrane protein [Leptospira kirschneri serovar Mozdok]|nr:putative membrane protein [Leptospira kirschneri serovar Mozdok]
MKDLKYDSDTKEGMIGHLKQFHSKEISDITSVRIENKKKLGNIEIFYGIYQEK